MLSATIKRGQVCTAECFSESGQNRGIMTNMKRTLCRISCLVTLMVELSWINMGHSLHREGGSRVSVCNMYHSYCFCRLFILTQILLPLIQKIILISCSINFGVLYSHLTFHSLSSKLHSLLVHAREVHSHVLNMFFPLKPELTVMCKQSKCI